MTRRQFATENPDFPLLAAGETEAARRVLASAGALRPGERVTTSERAGEGNMNLTLRVTLQAPAGGERTLIVKQSRPWVEKYDHIAAPWDRANVEAAFLQHAAAVPAVARRMPRLLAHDPAARVLVLEDLGPSADFSGVYRGADLATEDLAALAGWLGDLHASGGQWKGPRLANREMRALNHAHIFEIPLADPPVLDLAALHSGLPAAAAELRSDPDYRAVVQAQARRYLHDGPTLLHGDFFPGSWLRAAGGDLYVIDAEFAFFGDAAFDLGVAVAHLALAGRPIDQPARFLAAYPGPVDPAQVAANAAVEVMRRLIGVAQLPLSPSLDRAALLRRTRAAALKHHWELLWHD